MERIERYRGSLLGLAAGDALGTTLEFRFPGRCFDIGNTTRTALARFELTNEPYPGPTDSYSAGNGSIMRLAPVPLFFARDPREAVARSAESSRTTHGAPECLDACRYLGGL